MDDVLKVARVAAVAAVLSLVSLIACSSSQSAGPTTDAGGADVTEDAFNPQSSCGHPGDMGNSLGVGKFCQYTIADCGMNTRARLCTTLDPKGDANYFCTFPCNPMTDPVDVCGERARCACDSTGGACGCFPIACDGPPMDGGKDSAADAVIDVRPETSSDATGN